MSLTEKYIESELSCQSSYKMLHEISEDRYNEGLKQVKYKVFIKDILPDMDLLNPPHPLLKVNVIENDEWSYGENGGFSWSVVFIFKYKGKHYLYQDCDSV